MRLRPAPAACARRAVAACLAAAAGLAALPAFGFGQNKIVYQNFEWKVYTSIHFEIFYYPEEEEFLDQMISNCESAYQKVSKALDYEPPIQTGGKATKIPVVFYKTHGEFEQTNIMLSEIDEAVGAFAEPFQGRIVIPIDGPPDKVYETLTHELTHIFEFSILYGDSLRRIIRSNPPLWMMEGLASYIGEDEDNIDRMVIRDAVVNNILPSVRQLNQLSFLTYRYGHAIFDFINEDWGPSGIRNFLWEYRKVLLTDNVPHAIKEAFGIEVDEFDRRFNRYLRKKYFPVLMEKYEPDDYGKDIGIKDPGRHSFSPTLSPSGELVAVLATPVDELDVVVLSAKDGKKIRNLTKGFTNKYDHLVAAAFEGKRDLSWSPEGDNIAFFVRRENFRDLWIMNAVTGDRVLRMKMPVDIPTSPAFSPDGTKLLFAGNRAGIFDIFELDLATKKVQNLTDDNFYDANPAWSPDGKTALYNRRIGQWTKIFLFDVANPQRKTQLTFGESQDIMPVFGRDGRTVYFVSDRGSLGIFNVWSLDTESGEMKRWTDLVGGAFSPVELAEEENHPRRLAYASYYRGAFRLYTMDLDKPVEVISPEASAEALDPTPFQAPLQLTSDEAEKKPYKLRWSIDAPEVAIGVADDGTVFSNSTIIFSDLLGDYRVRANLSSVSSYSNIDVLFLNLKRRFQWGSRLIDYRDYYVATDITTGDTDTKRYSRYTGLSASGQYPFNKYYRVEGDLGYLQRSLDYPFYDTSGRLRYQGVNDDYVIARIGLSGDTLRGREFGPYHGKRFQLNASRGAQVSGDTGSFNTYSLDFRTYGRLTRRSLIAWRLASVVTTGDGRSILSMGGFNQLRGYDFRTFSGNSIAYSNLELRFPLIDELRFPFGSIGMIRGTIFFDAGAAWFEDSLWFDPKVGAFRGYLSTDSQGRTISVPIKFDAWDGDNDRFQDMRASWGLGLHFLFGGLEWHWDFARLLPYTEYKCRGGVDFRTGFCPQVPEKVEVNDGAPRTTFWIGFSF